MTFTLQGGNFGTGGQSGAGQQVPPVSVLPANLISAVFSASSASHERLYACVAGAAAP